MLLIAFTYYHTILLVHIISQGKSKGDTRKEETH